MILIVHLALIASGDAHMSEELGNESHSINHQFRGSHLVTRTSRAVTHPKTPLAQARLIVDISLQSSPLSLLPHLQNLSKYCALLNI
jgi:hypothetical protein